MRYPVSKIFTTSMLGQCDSSILSILDVILIFEVDSCTMRYVVSKITFATSVHGQCHASFLSILDEF